MEKNTEDWCRFGCILSVLLSVFALQIEGRGTLVAQLDYHILTSQEQRKIA